MGASKEITMAKKNRNNIDYPKRFMKQMKKKKKKRIRNTPIEKDIIENEFNTAEREI